MVPDQSAKSYNLININYYMAIFMSYPISIRDTHISPRAFSPRADMGVSGWYGVWYENSHIINYLSYIFLSDKFAFSISYAESRSRPPSAPNVVIWVFCPSKKAPSPTWSGNMLFFFFFFVFFFCFLPWQKKPYHPHDLVISFFFFFFFFFFCPGKKAVSPAWPIFAPLALHKSDMCLKIMIASHMQNEHIF